MPDTLFSLCTPRKSVFDASRRDTVLDLTDLLDGKSPHPSCRNLFFVMQDTLIPRIDENIDGFVGVFGDL